MPGPSRGKSHAFAISFSLLLLLAISAISLSFWNAAENSTDATSINLVGRQRMLTQQIEKNLLKLSHAAKMHLDTSLIRQELSQSYFLFNQTLTILEQGKLVDKKGRSIAIASTQSKQAVALIQQASAAWAPLQLALLPVISSSAKFSNSSLKRALFIVMRDNPRLLLLMNSLTAEIENAAHTKSRQLRITEASAIVLILVNFGFVLFYFRRQLSLLSESKLLSMRIMENIGTAIIVINAKRDIELCNHAAENLFKYSTGNLTGENIRSLMDEPFFMQLGKRTDGERFALEIELNEIHTAGRTIFIASLYDLTEQKLREQQLSHLAHHDPLTGLPNRLLFMDRLAQTIARAHRNNELSAVLFLDLDRFKPVNDSMGHATGDLLLKNVAIRLSNCLREGDTIARLGGDEFAMIIDASDINNSTTISHKLLSELAREFNINGHIIRISGSIGASIYPDDSSEIHALLHCADIAMYQAKALGGNACCKYHKTLPVAESIQA